MNNKMKKTIMAAVVVCGCSAFAHNGYNHWLAADIVRSCAYVLGGAVRPAPVVVTTTPVVTTPVVTTPVVTTPIVTTPVVTTPVVTTPTVVTTTTTVPTYSYGYYNNVYCPTYSGYYYYNNAWVWGGGYGYRPPIPRWIPPYRGPHYRPVPPPIHHGGFHGGYRPPPRPCGPGGFHGGPRGGDPHRR